ncbi:hypothetical protein KFE25_000242 [Diacronema lutheri]|uniref:HMG box domain-containing protein n=1 Tax=Diacronema lutheri TaxID=2081491 RepID=A0A8J5XP06_DIALT|nr:hypothetical protein KFE25_000242 [Diacronema lutheri]
MEPPEGGAPASADDLDHLSAQQRRLLQRKLDSEAIRRLDASATPIKTFSRAGRQVRVFDEHRLLADLPAGWLLEQVGRPGKSHALRACDNFWLEPSTDRRFDSLRKVRAHLDPHSEEAMIIAERNQDNLAWQGADVLDVVEPKRQKLISDDEELALVLDAIVFEVEALHSYRPPPAGRSSRHAPTAEEMARRVEATIAEGPSAFLAFALAHRHEDEGKAEDEPSASVRDVARRLASRWRAAPLAARRAFEALAAAERAETVRSLGTKCKSSERAQRLEEARCRLFALRPDDVDGFDALYAAEAPGEWGVAFD